MTDKTTPETTAQDSVLSSPAMYLNGGLIMIAAQNHLIEAAGLLAGFHATALARGDTRCFDETEKALGDTMRALESVRARMKAENGQRPGEVRIMTAPE